MEIPKLEQMGSENLSSINEKNDQFEEKGAQKISVSHHQLNGLEYTAAHKSSDSFTVDIERFAPHLPADKNISANSRITRSLSRKGSLQRGSEKKSNFLTRNERDNGSFATSPRASLLHGGSTPEKPTVVVVGATDHHSLKPQVHNPITIMTGSLGTSTAESKSNTIGRRFSFRRSSAASWTFDPRKILLFFATLSSMGTILLIFFTLSMNKLNEDGNDLN